MIQIKDSHPHCIHEVGKSEVLMAKDSPTVPDGEVDVVSEKYIIVLRLHYIVIIKIGKRTCIWCQRSFCDRAIELKDPATQKDVFLMYTSKKYLTWTDSSLSPLKGEMSFLKI